MHSIMNFCGSSCKTNSAVVIPVVSSRARAPVAAAAAAAADVFVAVPTMPMEKEKKKNENLHLLMHDLRAPLNNIHLGVLVLKENNEEEKDSDRRRDQNNALEVIDDECTYMKRSVDNFLQQQYDNDETTPTPRINTFQLEPFMQTIINIVHFAAAAKNIQIDLSIHPAIKHLFLIDRGGGDGGGDRMQMQRAFVNLLSNAIKYAPIYESLVVAVFIRIYPLFAAAAAVAVAVAENNDIHIVFDIIDNNDYIPPNIKTKLFHKGNSSSSNSPSPHMHIHEHDRGFGLGLYSVKKFVNERRGTIQHCFVPGGRGNIFRLTLEFPHVPPPPPSVVV